LLSIQKDLFKRIKLTIPPVSRSKLYLQKKGNAWKFCIPVVRNLWNFLISLNEFRRKYSSALVRHYLASYQGVAGLLKRLIILPPSK
jgi:hypothetical protein